MFNLNRLKTFLPYLFVSWEILCNILLALVYGRFAMLMGISFTANPRLSTFLLGLKESLCFVLLLTRRFPKNVSTRLYPWAASIAGTCAPLLLRPAAANDQLAGQVIQCAGYALSLWSFLALNRSFGIVPANRGIKRSGPYRFVRHPIYLGYAIGNLGFVMNQLSGANIILYFTATAISILRLIEEERFLDCDAAYQDYCRSTKWRLIPLVF